MFVDDEINESNIDNVINNVNDSTEFVIRELSFMRRGSDEFNAHFESVFDHRYLEKLYSSIVFVVSREFIEREYDENIYVLIDECNCASDAVEYIREMFMHFIRFVSNDIEIV